MLALFAVGRGVEDEGDGLGDGHEVALDLGVGDGQGAALGQLLLEEGDDGAGGAEDVAEADGHEPRPGGGVRCPTRLQIESLHIELGEALGGAHDVGGVDGLVGGDLDEGLGTGGTGGVGDVFRADRVGQHALAGVELDHGHMLQGRGVEDDLWPHLCEDLGDAAAAADVAEEGLALEVGEARADFVVDLVEVVLGVVEEGELGRIAVGDLADELRADAAAGTGDEDTAADDQAVDGLLVEHGLWAAEQVLEGHGLEIEATGAAGLAELVEGGDAAEDHAVAGGLVQKRLQAVLRQRVGDDEADRALTAPVEQRHGGVEVVGRAQDGHAVEVAAAAGAVVVEDADDGVGVGALMVHDADEGGGGVAGAEQEDGHGALATLAGGIRKGQVERQVGAGEAVGDACAGQEEGQDQPLDDRQGARHALAANEEEEGGVEDEDAERDDAEQVQELGRRGVAPDVEMHAVVEHQRHEEAEEEWHADAQDIDSGGADAEMAEAEVER